MSFLRVEGLVAPHAGQPVQTKGTPLNAARAALIMLHGRGATADGILSLADELEVPPDVALLAPQAAENTWYPHRFLAPIAQNEPDLSSALAFVDAIVAAVADADIPLARVALLGFSQGACLALEYAARHPRRYGGVVGFSGGLIGPEGTDWSFEGSFDGTPVFLGCSDVDPHIPAARVRASAEVFRRMGADVTERLYPGMDHTINQDEMAFLRALVHGLST